MMQNSTLFLIQAPYQSMANTWSKLEQMATVTDHIVMMGDAVLTIPMHILTQFPNLYCLEVEENLLNESIQTQIKVLEYATFADLTLQFKRCISLK